MDNILSTILNNTYTLTQLNRRLRVLKAQLLKNLFGGEVISEPISDDLNWLKSLPENFLSQFNKDNVYQIFTSIETAITNLQLLTVYLAFEADNTTIEQVGNFARKIFNPSLLLDAKFDPNIIAGAALVWKGVYKDYSLRAKLKEKEGEISQSFKKFLK